MEDMIMRKISVVSILAAAAAMMISCDKSELQQSMPSTMTFTGSIDNVATKTTLTEADKLNWEAGDEIDINGTVFVATPDASDASKATFAKKAGADPELVSGKYDAFYPASLMVEGVPTLPLVQTYSANSLAAVNPMYAQSEDNALSFKNICGLLEISLKGTKTVSAIRVYSDNLGMSGAFTLDGDFNAVVEGTDEVYLDCGNGVKLSSRNATKFYVAIPAGTYENLGIVVYSADDCVAVVSTEEAVVKRNVIYAVAPTLEFISLDYLAFVGDYAYAAIDYFDDYAETTGYMEVYPLEYNKTFALFFPEATPEYEGEYYDYFLATYDSRSKTMVLANDTISEEGAIWGFNGIDGYCEMSMHFGYWFDEDNTPLTSLSFSVDEDYNLTYAGSAESTDEEGDYVYFEAEILSEEGKSTGYATSILIVGSELLYNIENLGPVEEKPQSRDLAAKIASRKPMSGKGLGLQASRKASMSIEKGTGAYLMQ